MRTKVIAIEQRLKEYADPVKQIHLPRFFKTGKGEYGEGDCFLGVTVPHIRLVSKQYSEEPLALIKMLLHSEWHECRMCALLMLIEKFKKGNEATRQEIYSFYLLQTERINNWDLVDLSAPVIVGGYLKDKPREELYNLAKSSLLWDQRIAVVSTLTLIRSNDFSDTLCLAERLLNHPHDLMQKAIGWMLREVGKRDRAPLIEFLEKYSKKMPRTMLRYAIEKFTPEERAYFMKR